MSVFGKQYSSIYDCLYREKDYRLECSFIDEIIKNKAGRNAKTVLDLGCGTGGHAILLSEMGYEVTGVDQSEEMLRIAAEKAENANADIKFVKADIRELNINEKFDIVISMFAVMGYQTGNDDLDRACSTAYKHLKAGGLFIFDCWNGIAVLNDRPGVRMKEVKIDNERKIIRYTEPVLDFLNNIVDVRFKVLTINDSVIENESSESHLMRYIFPKEIEYYLDNAGFSQVSVCPFLEFQKDLTENDWDMTVMALKEGKNE